MFQFDKKNVSGSDARSGKGPYGNASQEAWNEVANDNETFIRNAFQQDAATGCKLLFKRYFNGLCSHAVRFVYSKQLAEDIVSEVFCRFWEKKGFLHIRCSYRAYLFTAVRNASINQLKKEFGKSIIETEGYENHFSTESDTQLSLQADELNQLIEKTIRSLPPKCQSVFLMSRLEGKKNAEIAKELDISVKAVEGHITRALDKLRKVLKDEYLY